MNYIIFHIYEYIHPTFNEYYRIVDEEDNIIAEDSTSTHSYEELRTYVSNKGNGQFEADSEGQVIYEYLYPI